MEVGINGRVGFFGKKQYITAIRRSGGWKKSKKSINMEGRNVYGGWIFFQNQ